MAEAELEALNRAHHEHMLEMVNTAQTLENKRHARLGAAKSQAEAAQLEKRFTRERRHEETRIQQIQEEHSHLCQVRGRSLSRPFPLFSRPAPPLIAPCPPPPAQLTVARAKAAAEGPAVAGAPEAGPRPIKERVLPATTTQDLEFMKAVYAKLEPNQAAAQRAAERERGARTKQHIESARFHDGVAATARGSVRALAPKNQPVVFGGGGGGGGGDRRDLLVRKKALLQRLHHLVSVEERILHDGGSTGRSQALSGFDTQRAQLRSSASRSTTSTQASAATFLSRSARPKPFVDPRVPPLRL